MESMTCAPPSAKSLLSPVRTGNVGVPVMFSPKSQVSLSGVVSGVKLKVTIETEADNAEILSSTAPSITGVHNLLTFILTAVNRMLIRIDEGELQLSPPPPPQEPPARVINMGDWLKAENDAKNGKGN